MAKSKAIAILNKQLDEYCDKRADKWDKLVKKMVKAGTPIDTIEEEQLCFNAVTHHYCYKKITEAGADPNIEYEYTWE